MTHGEEFPNLCNCRLCLGISEAGAHRSIQPGSQLGARRCSYNIVLTASCCTESTFPRASRGREYRVSMPAFATRSGTHLLKVRKKPRNRHSVSEGSPRRACQGILQVLNQNVVKRPVQIFQHFAFRSGEIADCLGHDLSSHVVRARQVDLNLASKMLACGNRQNHLRFLKASTASPPRRCTACEGSMSARRVFRAPNIPCPVSQLRRGLESIVHSASIRKPLTS